MKNAFLSVFTALAITLTNAAAGQSSFPDRPARMVVSAAAGGGTDIIARLVARYLSEVWGQPVIVENKAGGGGNIAAQFVTRSKPDGYTLLVSFGGVITINPYLYVEMGFDPIKDLTPITNLATAPYVLAVNPSMVPANSVAEFIAFAKSSPTDLSWGSTAKGSPDHLAGELFSSMAGFRTIHIPYKGGAEALVDVLGNRIPYGFFTIPSSLSYLKSGQLKALGISDRKRASLLPNVPSLSDTLPGYEILTWYGVWAPAGTPTDVVTKIQADIKRVLDTDAVKRQLADRGFDVVGDTPSAFAAFIKNESEKYGQIIARIGLKKN